jgi:hypothetical protein
MAEATVYNQTIYMLLGGVGTIVAGFVGTLGYVNYRESKLQLHRPLEKADSPPSGS